MPRFRKGDVILFSKPYAIAVQDTVMATVCSYCFKVSDDLTPCSACNTFYYCGDTCKMKDLLDHCMECKVTSKDPEDLMTTSSRVTLRMCMRHIREEGRESTEGVLGRTRSIHDLVSHENLISDELRESYKTTTDNVRQRLSGIYDLDKDLFYDMLNKVAINCHEVICPRNWTIGRVVYLGASGLNHSCEVHDRYSPQFVGGNYVIYALKDIVINNVKDLKITYVPLMMSVYVRRKHLKNVYYFNCFCRRCRKELAACTPKDDRRLVQEITKKVMECDTDDAEQRYAAMIKILKRVRHLHDSNYYKYWIMSDLMYRCTQTERNEEAIYIGMRLLSVSFTGQEMEIILDKLCLLMNQLGWNEQSHPKFNEYQFYVRVAVKYFQMTRGPKDFITKYHRRLLKETTKNICWIAQ